MDTQLCIALVTAAHKTGPEFDTLFFEEFGTMVGIFKSPELRPGWKYVWNPSAFSLQNRIGVKHCDILCLLGNCTTRTFSVISEGVGASRSWILPLGILHFFLHLLIHLYDAHRPFLMFGSSGMKYPAFSFTRTRCRIIAPTVGANPFWIFCWHTHE